MSATEPRSRPAPGDPGADGPRLDDAAAPDQQNSAPTAPNPTPAPPDQPAPDSGPSTIPAPAPTPVPIAKAAPPVPAVPDEEERPRATRIAEGAMLGGVCTGLARHLGWPVMVIRIGFVGADVRSSSSASLAYGAALAAAAAGADRAAPGLESASRSGMRDAGASRTAAIDWGMLLALVALGIGLLWIVQTSGLGISQQLFWPVAFACAGAALVWRQADISQQKRWRAEAGGRAVAGAVRGPRRLAGPWSG